MGVNRFGSPVGKPEQKFLQNRKTVAAAHRLFLFIYGKFRACGQAVAALFPAAEENVSDMPQTVPNCPQMRLAAASVGA